MKIAKCFLILLAIWLAFAAGYVVGQHDGREFGNVVRTGQQTYWLNLPK